MNRLTWPLGIILLVGSLVGAGWALNHTTPHAGDVSKDNHEPLREVFCLGNIDVEDGVADLLAKQAGQVVEIAAPRVTDKDGTERERIFKKGEILLRLKSEMAEFQVGKAKAALAAAQAELAKAHQLAPKHKIEIKMQQDAIRAYGQEKVKLEADLDAKQQMYKENFGLLSQHILKAMKAAVAEAEAKIDVEKGKLDLLMLAEPELEVNRAKADVDAKQTDVKIAEDVVKEFRIEAPFDGILLRVHTRVGELIGPNPRMPALEFCPNVTRIVRAEVIQEWGHRVHVGQEATSQDDTYQGPRMEVGQRQEPVGSLSAKEAENHRAVHDQRRAHPRMHRRVYGRPKPRAHRPTRAREDKDLGIGSEPEALATDLLAGPI